MTKVLVNVGDTITREQPVLELETDKATIEVPSSVAGVVKEIKVKKGDKVKVGAVMLTVDADGNGSWLPPKKPTAEAAPASGTGSRAEAAPNQASASAEKVVPMPSGRQPQPPAPAPQPRRPRRQATMGRRRRRRPPFAASRAKLASTSMTSRHRTRRAHHGGRRQGARATHPEQRRLDVSAVRRGTPATGVALPDFEKWGAVERQPMSNIRRETAEHLSHAWTTIPHVTQFDKADVTDGGAALEVTQAGGAGGRQPDGDRGAGEVMAAAVKQVPAVQCVDRHRATATSSTRNTSTSASPWTPIAGCSCR